MTDVKNKQNIARIGSNPRDAGRHCAYFSSCSLDTPIPSVRPTDPCALGEPVITPYQVHDKGDLCVEIVKKLVKRGASLDNIIFNNDKPDHTS